MYNNKQYNTRHSGRYNTAGQFVPSAEHHHHQQQQQQQKHFAGGPQRAAQPPQPVPQPPQPPPASIKQVPLQEEDEEMKPVMEEKEEAPVRPAWMKPKLAGVKKIPNRERRRRQNETLRRLLTPKNALMVLNEMMPKDNLSNQFTVEAAQNQYYSRNNLSFCADLTLDGTIYKGYGENKLSARNNAAEQAIRDLIIKKMNKVVAAAGDGGLETGGDEESLPMIQLASFALHKLFTEWEVEGHKVPQLRGNNSVSESGGSEAGAGAGAAGAGAAGASVGTATAALAAMSEMRRRAARAKPAKPRVLPGNAASMHPSMLLSYMRPGVEYRELAAEGDKPQNMVFTMGVDVDNATYLGKASNKKEARKAAARAACSALFGVSDTAPSVPKVEQL